LKPNSVAAFTQTIETDIIPLLRTQPGFQDAMVFVVPGGTAAVAVSVWDQQEHAEAYARGTSPHVLQAVTKVVEGTPQVSAYEVGRPQPPFLWSGKVTWTYLEDSVLPAVHFYMLTAVRPEGPAEGVQGSFLAPRAPAQVEGAPQGRRA
jgi:heme-degrading monooxygenase HmoA